MFNENPYAAEITEEQERYGNDVAQEEVSKAISGVMFPKANDYAEIFISTRFEEYVRAHVIFPYLKSDIRHKSPIFLVVLGNPGEGKTSQAIAVCLKYNFNVIYCSSSLLSGTFESSAVNIMKSIYESAIQDKELGKYPVIILDDFHKSIVNNDANIKKTINSELLTGYLMNLAEKCGKNKIPIIITANEIDSIYPPLLRTGRANIFYWKPKYAEKKMIITNIMLCDFPTVDWGTFVDEFIGQPISFFVQIKNRLRHKALNNYLFSHNENFCANDKMFNELDIHLNANKYNISEQMLIETSEEILRERSE